MKKVKCCFLTWNILKWLRNPIDHCKNMGQTRGWIPFRKCIIWEILTSDAKLPQILSNCLDAMFFFDTRNHPSYIIKGRMLADGFVVVNEVINLAKLTRKYGLVFKVDFEGKKLMIRLVGAFRMTCLSDSILMIWGDLISKLVCLMVIWLCLLMTLQPRRLRSTWRWNKETP